jgi:cytidine deaminase
MDLSIEERHLVDAATELLARRDDGHSHAAALLCSDGQVFMGVNLYHFSGGPCAEMVALGRMLTDTSSRPRTIVAVARDGSGVVSPCGVCRQIMHDRWPDVKVILARDNSLYLTDLGELLPRP